MRQCPSQPTRVVRDSRTAPGDSHEPYVQASREVQCVGVIPIPRATRQASTDALGGAPRSPSVDGGGSRWRDGARGTPCRAGKTVDDVGDKNGSLHYVVGAVCHWLHGDRRGGAFDCLSRGEHSHSCARGQFQ